MPDPSSNPQSTPPEAPRLGQTAKPPGILPKNTQAWVIAGLAAVMVAAIALSGNGSKSKQSAQPPRQAAVIDPNVSRIAEYRNQLDEETRKLAAEQAALNQAKQAAAGSDPRVAAAIEPGGPPNPYTVRQPPSPDERQSAKKQLEAEQDRKDYDSLFASNVALTFRKDSQDHDTAAPPPTSPAPVAALYPYLYPVPPQAPATHAGATQGVAPAAGSLRNPALARAPQAETGSGRNRRPALPSETRSRTDAR